MDRENDLFCEIIKDKIANYTLPVDDDSWNKIAERLNTAPRKKTQRLWIAAIAVPASIAFLFLIFSINKKTYQHETTTQLSHYEKTIIQNVSEKEIDRPVLQQNFDNSPVFGKSQSRKCLAENNLTTEVIPTKDTTEENSAIPSEEKPTALGENPAVSAKEEPTTSEKYPVSPDFSFDSEKEIQIPPIRDKHKQSIRLSFSAGGNLLADNMSNLTQGPALSPGRYLDAGMTYYKEAVQNVANSQSEAILSYEDYPNITYYPPLSFGITIKKELNRRFAIESGIVYSFLATAFSKESPLKSNANLQLHYIGIPLNVHTRILGDRSSRWEVYLSAGGTVEKGISSHFVQNVYYGNNDNSLVTVNSNEKIRGLQWSLSISPGIDYQIHKNYSIYLEPKVGYYFDNDQPISARTKHPVVAGINAGIRYSW